MAEEEPQKHPYRLVIVGTCFGIQAVGIGTYNAFGVFFVPLMSEFGWSRAAVSGASSIAFFGMGFLAILAGRLNDLIGPRLVMTVTAVCFGLGHLLMARVESLWQLYVFYGVAVGIGLCAVDVISLTTVARWFRGKRGTITGIVKMGTGAGQVVVPLVVSFLIAGYGWRITFVVLGSVGLCIMVGLALLLKRDPGQAAIPLQSPSTADKGPPGAKMASEVPLNRSQGLSFQQALGTPQLWTLCAIFLLLFFCMLMVVVHIVPYARDMEIPAGLAAGVLSAIGGVSIVGRFMTGVAIDRIGSKRVMIICFILLMAALLWLLASNTLLTLYLFALIYGLAHGGFFTVISPVVADFFGIRAHGALLGVVVFCGTIGGSIGPVVGGYIFDTTGGYQPAFWLCLLMIGLGFGLLFRLRPMNTSDSGIVR